MNNSIRDYEIPLIIDIGSDRVKFSQPDLNLTQIYKNAKINNFTEDKIIKDISEEENKSMIYINKLWNMLNMKNL